MSARSRRRAPGRSTARPQRAQQRPRDGDADDEAGRAPSSGRGRVGLARVVDQGRVGEGQRVERGVGQDRAATASRCAAQRAEGEADREREREAVGVEVHERRRASAERRHRAGAAEPGRRARAGARRARRSPRRGRAATAIRRARRSASSGPRGRERLVEAPEALEVAAGGGGQTSDCSSIRPRLADPERDARAGRRRGRAVARRDRAEPGRAARPAGARRGPPGRARRGATVPRTIGRAGRGRGEAAPGAPRREHRRDADERYHERERRREGARAIGPGWPWRWHYAASARGRPLPASGPAAAWTPRGRAVNIWCFGTSVGGACRPLQPCEDLPRRGAAARAPGAR